MRIQQQRRQSRQLTQFVQDVVLQLDTQYCKQFVLFDLVSTNSIGPCNIPCKIMMKKRINKHANIEQKEPHKTK